MVSQSESQPRGHESNFWEILAGSVCDSEPQAKIDDAGYKEALVEPRGQASAVHQNIVYYNIINYNGICYTIT